VNKLFPFTSLAFHNGFGQNQPGIDGEVYHFQEITDFQAEAIDVIEKLARLYFPGTEPQ